eukprot:CAMPEP_0202725214 /NCGR_PEP_ID=MMETSP1385-20130828/180168_1 /ASSEMBLY_ACC=CAM_ASM_000861 /TAXON_ID=933848 /ORGANISM="Elphidium margaritaceum" /LENGTH=208 /DNA_ID=CAMNT_0049391167 /DNA_START=154 /DNA_END=777 /DNA_ORIENTATION=+
MNHFYNNFVSIVFCGTHIINNAGSFAFWMTALNGSIFGALASLVEYKYHHSQSRLEHNKTETKSVWDRVTETPMVQYYGNKVIDATFELLNDSIAMVGCSSAVYALYAFDFALTFDRSKKRLARFWRKYVYNDETVLFTESDIMFTVFDMVSLFSAIKRIQHDIEFLWFDNKHRTKSDHLMVASPDNIAHGSHIGGFLSGLLSYSLWK